MLDNDRENVLVMAMLMVTRDDVMTCADEAGIPREQVTDGKIELVKEKVSQGLGAWREVMKELVKEVIEQGSSECPLGKACSPACTWREVGGCVLSSNTR